MFERRRRPGGLRIREGISDRQGTIFRKEAEQPQGFRQEGRQKLVDAYPRDGNGPSIIFLSLPLCTGYI
jgi:hypothetical protein